MLSYIQPISSSFEDLYIRVVRLMKLIEPGTKMSGRFENLCRSFHVLERFDPAPWKTQRNSLAALVTSIRFALLTQVLAGQRSAGFEPVKQTVPLQGFFESQVNKRNAP